MQKVTTFAPPQFQNSGIQKKKKSYKNKQQFNNKLLNLVKP